MLLNEVQSILETTTEEEKQKQARVCEEKLNRLRIAMDELNNAAEEITTYRDRDRSPFVALPLEAIVFHEPSRTAVAGAIIPRKPSSTAVTMTDALRIVANGTCVRLVKSGRVGEVQQIAVSPDDTTLTYLERSSALSLPKQKKIADADAWAKALPYFAKKWQRKLANITDEQTMREQMMREAFAHADTDGDGVIGLGEVKAMVTDKLSLPGAGYAASKLFNVRFLL
ncbi:unnamed protein product [Sphagnum balticum]